MKIMWIGNGPINKVYEITGKKEDGDIGWISSALFPFLEDDSLQIVYVYPQTTSSENIYGEKDNFKYYGLYRREKKTWICSKSFREKFEVVLQKENPDIIQIWGTEYAHSLDAFETAEKIGASKKIIIHIQGLISVYADNFFAGVPNTVCKMFSFRDLIRRSNISCEKKKYKLRGKNEIELLKNITYVMGRTDWDRFHTQIINSNIKYFKCNESMREVFFQYKWRYSDCEKHTICVTQGNYPIKGFHYLVQAVGILIKFIPDLKVYVSGENIIYHGKDVIRQSTYALYVKSLMKKWNVQDNFIFLGYQNEENMARMYKKSNVFVLPSAMENSPNSLAEALIVGTPCVAADVGGVSSMVENGIDCITYQYNDPVMLAMYIQRVMTNKELAERMSDEAIKKARKSYCAEDNKKRILEIYNEIICINHEGEI